MWHENLKKESDHVKNGSDTEKIKSIQKKDDKKARRSKMNKSVCDPNVDTYSRNLSANGSNSAPIRIVVELHDKYDENMKENSLVTKENEIVHQPAMKVSGNSMKYRIKFLDKEGNKKEKVKPTISTNTDHELSRDPNNGMNNSLSEPNDDLTIKGGVVSNDEVMSQYTEVSEDDICILSSDQSATEFEITDDERDINRKPDRPSQPTPQRKSISPSTSSMKKKRKFSISKRNQAKLNSDKRKGRLVESTDDKRQEKKDKKARLLEMLCKENEELNARLCEVEEQLSMYLKEQFSIVGESKMRMKMAKDQVNDERSEMSLVQLSRRLNELEPFLPSTSASDLKQDVDVTKNKTLCFLSNEEISMKKTTFNSETDLMISSLPHPINRKPLYTVLRHSGRPKSSSTLRDEYNAININRRPSLPVLREVERPTIVYKVQPSAINCDLTPHRNAWEAKYRPSSSPALLSHPYKRVQKRLRRNSLLCLRELQRNKQKIRYGEFYVKTPFANVQVICEEIREAIIIQQNVENPQPITERIDSRNVSIIEEMDNESKDQGIHVLIQDLTNDEQVVPSTDANELTKNESNNEEKSPCGYDNKFTFSSAGSNKEDPKVEVSSSSNEASDNEEKQPLSETEYSSDGEDEIEITDDERTVNPVVFKFIDRLRARKKISVPQTAESDRPCDEENNSTNEIVHNIKSHNQLKPIRHDIQGSSTISISAENNPGKLQTNLLSRSKPLSKNPAEVQREEPVVKAPETGWRWKQLFRKVMKK